MEFGLRKDLERLARRAVLRAADSGRVIRRFHRLRRSKHPDYRLMEKAYRWIFVPRSVWPIDISGLCWHLLERIAENKRVDRKIGLLCSLLPEPPLDAVCDRIASYERAVKSGSYESLINAQFKFDTMELELRDHEEFKADWERLKAEFEVERYRNVAGIIRRRMVQERNFRPADWGF